MMRLYVLAAGNERGGAASHIATLALAMKDAELLEQVRFVLVGDGHLADRLKDIIAPSVAVVSGNPIKAVPELRMMLKEERDVPLVHAHGPRINVMARIVCRNKYRWTSTIHSDVFKDFLSSQWKSVLLPRVNLMALKRSVGIFVVNPLYSEFLPEKKSFLVPNGIPMTTLPHPKQYYMDQLRVQLHIPKDSIVVGIAARLDPVKDIPTLVDAIRLLDRTDVHLAIAGDGPERTTIEERIRSQGLTTQVHMLGFVNDIQPFFAGLTVNVLPSKSEGSPTTLLEAGIAQTPNIGSDIPGIARLLRNGETGLLFRQGDAPDLAYQLARIVNDSEYAKTVTDKFESEVLPRYTPSEMLHAYRVGYRQLMGDASILKPPSA